MGKVKAAAFASALGAMTMDTFDQSKYAKQRAQRAPETLAFWIEHNDFDPEDEEYLVDLPDHVPDYDSNAQTFASQMASKYNEYGRKMFVTEGQLRFLNNIIRKYCE